MGRGKGCCGKSFEPGVGDKNAQVLEGETGKWLPCEVKDVKSLGCCSGKQWEVEYTPSTGNATLTTMTVPKAKLREKEAAIALGPDGYPDLDKNRSCTDILCIIIFILFVVGWVVVGTVAFAKGDPARLLMPNDFRDEICGDAEPRKNYTAWYVPQPDKFRYGICVDKCPELGSIVCNNDWEDMAAFQAAGVKWSAWQPANGNPIGNKKYELSRIEVDRVNAIFSSPLASASAALSLSQNGTTGQIADVLSKWPNIPLSALDPIGVKRDCAWRRDLASTPGALAALYPGGSVCTPSEEALIERMLETDSRVLSYNCFSVIYRSRELVYRCIPETDSNQGEESSAKLKRLAESSAVGRYLAEGFGELQACWRIFILSAFTAIIISFIALILVRILLKPIVYTLLLLILLVLVAAGTAAHLYANKLDSVTLPGDTSHEQQVQTWRAFSYIFWGASCIYFVVMLWLISRVRIAICVLEQASKALFSSPSVLVIPPLMFLCLVAAFAWFLILAAYIQTVQDVTIEDFTKPINDTIPYDLIDQLPDINITAYTLPPVPGVEDLLNTTYDLTLGKTNISNITSYSPDQEAVNSDTIIRYMHAYSFFGLLWVLQLLIAMAFFVISGVVIMWFWSASTAEMVGEGKSKSTPALAMKNAFYRMLRYHLGTLLFGSLLIAIIQFVRALLLYVEKQLPEELTESAQFKIIKCVVHCFLAYLERIVKIINKNAYVICGIFGNNFCSSARKAFCFLIANIARTAVLAAMGEVVMFLLKVLICGANVYLAILVIREPSTLTSDEHIESVCVFFFFFFFFLNSQEKKKNQQQRKKTQIRVSSRCSSFF